MTTRPITPRALLYMKEKSKTGSIYSVLPVKGSHRARREPRTERHYRQRHIAWAGPDVWHKNRFFEIDRWYKARIYKPTPEPNMHAIDPDEHRLSLEQRLQARRQAELAAAGPAAECVNIGFKLDSNPARPKRPSDQLKELERAARTLNLKVDLTDLEWAAFGSNSSTSLIRRLCQHSSIYEHLFNANVYFNDVVPFRVAYQDRELDQNDQELPVYYGNYVRAQDMTSAPNVLWESPDTKYWTLLQVNLDGNPYEDQGDILQWMVCNIAGSDVSTGQVLCDYAQPTPFKGTGHSRVVTILLAQTQGKVNLDDYKRSIPCDSLYDRIFSTAEFYKANEAHLTPASLVFCQVEWDPSVQQCLHQRYDMPQPLYKFDWPAPEFPEQEEFPEQMQPFDTYLDQYRDPIEVDTELLRKRLARVSPFKPDEQRPKYQDVHYYENKMAMSTWQHLQQQKINAGIGKWKALYENRIE